MKFSPEQLGQRQREGVSTEERPLTSGGKLLDLIRRLAAENSAGLTVTEMARAISQAAGDVLREECQKEGPPVLRLVKPPVERPIVGLTDVMREVEQVARFQTTVVIIGETGTGKELIAKAIHGFSNRRGKPFVVVNCGAVPDTLVEAQLFGHVKGAFTDATRNADGAVACAEGGTLFLDEIGDLSLAAQAKLLRLLQEKEYWPVGANGIRKADVRVVAATNKDLAKAVKSRNFREDLFYRLSFSVYLPPLRERRDEIPLIAEHLLREINAENRTNVAGFSAGAMSALQQHDWPGNVRELRNVIEHAVVMCRSGITIESEDLRASKLVQAAPIDSDAAEAMLNDPGFKGLTEVVHAFEKALIQAALDRTDGNKNQAAHLLQLNRTTLVEKIKKLQRLGLLPASKKEE